MAYAYTLDPVINTDEFNSYLIGALSEHLKDEVRNYVDCFINEDDPDLLLAYRDELLDYASNVLTIQMNND